MERRRRLLGRRPLLRSAADTSVGHCTLGGATLASCAAQIEEPNAVLGVIAGCHWSASGVSVSNNDFSMAPSMTASCNARCGRDGLVASTAPTTMRVRLANGTVRIVTNPLAPNWARERVADPNVNRFTANRYTGAWSFDLGAIGRIPTGQPSARFDAASSESAVTIE